MRSQRPALTWMAAWSVVALATLIRPEARHGEPVREPDRQAQPMAPAFRSGIDLVALTVTVMDQARRPVEGLSAEDFTVLEDGVAHPVAYFASGRVPLDLAILLDSSASMLGETLARAQQAALGLARTLRPGDRLMVVQFANRTRVLHPLTDRIPEALSAVRETSAGGDTALYNALYVAMRDLAREQTTAGEFRRQVIAVVSDGKDTASVVEHAEVQALSVRSNIAVYPILLVPKTPDLLSEPTGHLVWDLRSIARATGADAYLATEASALRDIYRAIADELAHQYMVGYVSTNTRRDGAFRQVSVRLRPGNLVARTRTGYLAPD